MFKAIITVSAIILFNGVQASAQICTGNWAATAWVKNNSTVFKIQVTQAASKKVNKTSQSFLEYESSLMQIVNGTLLVNMIEKLPNNKTGDAELKDTPIADILNKISDSEGTCYELSIRPNIEAIEVISTNDCPWYKLHCNKITSAGVQFETMEKGITYRYKSKTSVILK